MKRKCTELIKSKDGKRAIFVDSENEAEIVAYLRKDKRHQKKFNFISGLILEGLSNSDLYKRENINERCKDVTAMRFFVGQENDRIYCKEITTLKGMFIVVTAILILSKKQKQLTQREITAIEKVGGYDYAF